jgi:excisionase family DNA binding protein
MKKHSHTSSTLKQRSSAYTDAQAIVSTMHTWLTIQELAECLRVSVRTIHYWTADGTLPVYKKGRVVRYSAEECTLALRAFRRKSSFETSEGTQENTDAAK